MFPNMTKDELEATLQYTEGDVEQAIDAIIEGPAIKCKHTQPFV